MNEQLKEDLLQAIKSGKSLEYGFNGEDEFAYDIFEDHVALNSVIEVLKKHKLIE